MEIVAAFMSGAIVGLMVASLAAVSGRCNYEESVREYYEWYYREKNHG